MRQIILAMMLATMTGYGVDERSSLATSQPATNPPPWVAALSPEQVAALSSERAKAILMARAAIEQREMAARRSAPQIMDFRVTETPEGWSVYVQFVGVWDMGKPYPAPGYFSTVYIDKNWTVRKVVGGA